MDLDLYVHAHLSWKISQAISSNVKVKRRFLVVFARRWPNCTRKRKERKGKDCTLRSHTHTHTRTLKTKEKKHRRKNERNQIIFRIYIHCHKQNFPSYNSFVFRSFFYVFRTKRESEDEEEKECQRRTAIMCFDVDFVFVFFFSSSRFHADLCVLWVCCYFVIFITRSKFKINGKRKIEELSSLFYLKKKNKFSIKLYLESVERLTCSFGSDLKIHLIVFSRRCSLSLSLPLLLFHWQIVCTHFVLLFSLWV